MKNQHISWTSLDDLIEQLRKVKEQLHGDGTVPVCIHGVTPIEVWSKEFYYDGGYCALDASDPTGCSFLSSRKTNDHGFLEKQEGFHDLCVMLSITQPGDHSENDRLNGRYVVEIVPESWEWLLEEQQKERSLFDGQLVQYKHTGEYDDELKCYPYDAFLPTGETARGPTMAHAKKALESVYVSKKRR